MNKSNITEMGNNEVIGKEGDYNRLFIYKIPKKNHDAILRLNKQFMDTLGKDGPLHMEFFCLSNNESLMPFTSIAKSISANQDDDVWMEIHSYRDRKHADKVQAKIENDENMKPLCGQFGDLMTPNSEGIMGDFNRIKI
jgi:uncharacterized protein YbaA (DUF1428 family)